MRESITEPLGGSTSRGEEPLGGDRIHINAPEVVPETRWAGNGAKQRRRIKTPDFLLVPHAALRCPDLNRTDALALAALSYRRRRGLELDVATLTAWCGWSRWTSQRTLAKLRRLDLLDDGGDLRPELFPNVAGSVRVLMQEVRKHGPLEALTLGQLRSWCALGLAKVRGAWFEVPADLLSRFLGVCEKTARRVLERLCSGKTVRVRSMLRRGAEVLVCGIVELQRAVGRAPFVRICKERERKPVVERRQQAEEPAKQPEAAVEAADDYAVEVLEGLRRGAFSGLSRPS